MIALTNVGRLIQPIKTFREEDILPIESMLPDSARMSSVASVCVCFL